MESGIYMIKLGNGYFYYGQSQILNKRKTEHLSRLRSNSHNFTGASSDENPFFGKNHSDEMKKHFSTIRKGLFSGEKHPRAKILLNTETGIFYGSCIEAALSINCEHANLRSKVNNRKRNNTKFIRV